MAVTADHAPFVRADLDDITFDNAVERVGQLVHAEPEPAEPRAVVFQKVVRKSGGAIEPQRFCRRFLSGIGSQIAAHQKFGACDPKFNVELAHQPSGQADMIGMHVRDDYPPDLAAFHRAGEQLFPSLLGILVLDAGVDNRPPVAVLQQVEIDVVELHRQSHPHPVHTGRDLDALSGIGAAVAERVVKIAAGTNPGFGGAQGEPFGRSNRTAATMGSRPDARQGHTFTALRRCKQPSCALHLGEPAPAEDTCAVLP
jgi:hypothetical protein